MCLTLLLFFNTVHERNVGPDGRRLASDGRTEDLSQIYGARGRSDKEIALSSSAAPKVPCYEYVEREKSVNRNNNDITVVPNMVLMTLIVYTVFLSRYSACGASASSSTFSSPSSLLSHHHLWQTGHCSSGSGRRSF